MAKKTSRIPCNLNFLGEKAFLGGVFCLEYPSRRSEKVNCHFVNYRFSFRKLQIFISFRSISFRFANYSKPVKTNKMADLPFPQIRAKNFRQQEIDLDQFTDEELIAVDTGLAESQFNIWKKSSRTTSRDRRGENLSSCQRGYYFM